MYASLRSHTVCAPCPVDIQLHEIQQSLHTSLYRAPLFCQTATVNCSPAAPAPAPGETDPACGGPGPCPGVSVNDFLLVRTKVTPRAVFYHVRELPVHSGECVWECMMGGWVDG